MKKINLIISIILLIFFTSCSFDKFSTIFSNEQEKKARESFSNDYDNSKCPVVIIPKLTSIFLKKSYVTSFKAKISKINTGCEFLSINKQIDKRQILINFKAQIEIVSKKTLKEDSLNELYLYVAMVNVNGKVLIKLLAPIKLIDTYDKKNNTYQLIKRSKFKFSYSEKNKNFKIYYGFQQNI